MVLVRVLLFAVVLVLFGSATYFLYARLVRDTATRLVWRGLGALLLAAPFFCGPRLRVFVGRGMFTRAGAAVVFAWWGVLLYALLVLLAIEMARRLRRAPVDPSRRLFLARTAAAGSLGMGSAIGSLGLYRAFAEPEVTELPIRLANLPKALEGFTLVQLSDIHVGPVIQERFVDMLIDASNRLKPDLVAITGDLVDGSPQQIGRFVDRFARLSSRHGTYMVSGNHDYYSGWDRWAPYLEAMGFHLLRNARTSIGDAAASFDLLGVEDWGGHLAGQSDYDLEAAVRGRDPSRASVLLAHQPSNLPKVADAGVGLQLSGHTHGGQLFPGTLIASAVWGRAMSGLSQHGSLWQFTSRGCGFVGPPMRVDAPPQIVKVVLVAG
jgi:predicted MPP superfamily phosphohydrolase